jgi:hypothetical protein
MKRFGSDFWFIVAPGDLTLTRLKALTLNAFSMTPSCCGLHVDCNSNALAPSIYGDSGDGLHTPYALAPNDSASCCY